MLRRSLIILLDNRIGIGQRCEFDVPRAWNVLAAAI